MDSNVDLIHYFLKSLRNQWCEHESGGGQSELVRSVCGSIRELDKDWSFLKMFVESISKWSDADQVIQKNNSGGESLVLKIQAVAMQIGKDLKGCAYSTRPQELLNILGDCKRKTHQDHLKAEIGQVLLYLSDITFPGHLLRSSFWSKFVESVRQNLQLMEDGFDGSLDCNQVCAALCNELRLIQRYLGGVYDNLIFCDSDYNLVIDDAFLTHVASVVLRIAYQSCNLWFNRTDPVTELVDLQHEIDLTNPEFLDLNLRFQQVLYKINGNDCCVDVFCSYILALSSNTGLENVLHPLVLYFLNCNQEDDDFSGEDVHSCSEEVKAVIAEAGFLHDAMREEKNTYHLPPPCFELLTKCFLLKADLFLKKQLMISISFLGQSEVEVVKGIRQDLRLFTKYLCQQEKLEYGKQSLELIEELANEVESLYQSLHSEKITESMVKHSLFQLLFKIVFFKAESFLTELLKSTSDTWIAYEKDQIESLLQVLKHVKRIVTDMLVRNSLIEDKFFIQVEALARMITVFSYSSLPISDKLKKMILSLPQLLDKLKHIKAKLREISQLFPKSNFPKTCELGFIDFLGRNLRELLKHDPESIASVKHHIEEVQLHLDSFKSFLMKVSDVEQGELKDLGNLIIDVAYKMEYVVESIEVEAHLDQWEHLFLLYDLLEEMRLINQQISKIHEMSYACRAENLPQTSIEMISRDTTPVINEILVELGDQEEVIIDRLTRGSSQRYAVSIVGMPGIGKTTLAKKVYNSQNVRYHFHRRAWCTVSQVCSKRELLLEILSGIHGLNDEIHQMTNEDLESKLRQCLLGNKYLIVMDDVWDIAAWNDLKISFPDDNRGSRILVTSRCWDVASKMKPGSDPHWIRQLSDDESWKLLEKKIFRVRGECCPEELLLVGKEISQHCKGLPLAVVAIAGLLQKTEKRLDSWKRISKSLSSQIINDSENRCMEILELSYNHLPDHLKACFLYLGVFLEDKDIPVNKLMRFWQAEGFIQKADSKSLEDAAEDCLMDLINRSLVMISKTRSNGKIKACRLHDLLRDLCHSKAKEENFLQLITRNDELYASFPDSNYGMEFGIYSPVPVTFESYRLSIYLNRNHFIDSRPSGLVTRSLILFASIDSEPRCSYNIVFSFICHNFKLLRLLDLESSNMGISFPAEIGVLVQLRYLAVSGYVQSIPPSISNLWKLETLVVKGLRGMVTLPETIWSMAYLRHLHVNNYVAFNLKGLEKVGSSLHLDNLVSFSTPSLSYGEETMNIFRRLLNLHTMKCIFSESWDSSRNCNRFPILDFLTHLESIKIIYHGRALNSGEFVLPLNLKKLTLSNFRLPWNHISMIGRLPNLRVLKLSAGAFEGQRWDMNEEEFKELKFLKLDTLNIAEWNASADHLPSLERLVLRNCKKLEKIPNDFVDITTLQMIEVQWCGQSVEESAHEIGDATEEIKVLISRS